MLDCHIQPVAREGWQAAGCVFFASEYPTLASVCWPFLPLGKPRLLVTKLFLLLCGLQVVWLCRPRLANPQETMPLEFQVATAVSA